MITLFTYGPAFGLPDPSPFVTKAEVLLKMSGLPYRTTIGDPRKAPKRKLPFIEDDHVMIADSTLIRLHLEDRHGIDFGKGLTDAQRGYAWAIEKMLEDNLYWVLMRERWMQPENFDKGPRTFFSIVPAPMRPLVIAKVKREVRRDLHGQGTSRLSRAEMERVATRTIDSLEAVLGDKPWLMGEEPHGVDATGFAFVAALMCPLFDSPIQQDAAARPALSAYCERGMRRWFPSLARSPAPA